MNDLATGLISMELPQGAKFIKERTIHITSGALDPDATSIKTDLPAVQTREEQRRADMPSTRSNNGASIAFTEWQKKILLGDMESSMSYQNTRLQK